jgi:outer membrane usher protein
MTLTQTNGQPVPFGAVATLVGENKSFIVGDGGQVYLTGMNNSGTLQLKWG